MAENKHSLRDIASLLARRSNIAETQAEIFVKAFIETVLDGLRRDMIVKVKGLGTFKLVTVESRESINVNTGERFMIDGHSKVSFTPDLALRDEINKPFADFQTVVLADTMNIEVIGKEKELQGEKEEVLPELEKPEQGQELPEKLQDEPGKIEPVQTVQAEQSQQPEPVMPPKQQEQQAPQQSGAWKKVAAVIGVLVLMALSYTAGYYRWPMCMAGQKTSEDVPRVEKKVQRVQHQPDSMASKPAPAARHDVPVQQYTQLEGGRYRIVGIKGTHTLGRGQSLREVAIKYYGHKDFTPYIIVLNNITNPDVVPLGKELQLPELQDTMPADSVQTR